ncbi:uncharacterized protein LOC144666872 isoform X3 [Oculina patagonica]
MAERGMETAHVQPHQSITRDSKDTQRIEYFKQRLSIAKEKGNKTEVFQAYQDLAASYYNLGDYNQAIEYLKLCLSIAKEVGDRKLEGIAYGNLGFSNNELGDYKQAIEYLKQCLSIAKKIGDRKLEGQAYGHFGTSYYRLGDYKQAIEYHKLCLSIAKEIGDRELEGQTYGHFGTSYYRLGDYKQAIEYLKLCLSIAKEIGDRKLEGQTYRNLGACYNDLGDYKQAIEYHKLCLSIAKEIGDRKLEGQTYRNLGGSYNELRDYKQAIEYHKLCLSIAKEVGDRKLEGGAYAVMGFSYNILKDYKHAVEYNKLSLIIAKEVGNRKLEGIAYGNLGDSYNGLGDHQQAAEYHKLSLSIAEEEGDKIGEKRAYERLEKLSGDLGDFDQAIIYNILCLDMEERAGVERTREDLKYKDIAGEVSYGSLVPNEIKARGLRAKLAYEHALRIGKVKVYRARIMFIGQDRAGKTSLKKSLLGMPFDPEEQSTVGIEVEPSSFKVDVEQAKDWQRTNDKLGVSQFAQELARMAAVELDKEEANMNLKAQDVPEEKRSHTNQVVINEDKTSHKDSAMSSSSDKVEKATAKNDHDDHHTDGKSENATEVPQLMIDPALPPEEVPKLKIDPALPPEEFTQYLIQHLEGLNLHTDSTSTEPVVDVDLWDFAGQHLYYASHPVFLSRRAIYLLVCNLSKGLNDTAQPSVRQGILDVRLENPNGETNLDDLLSWLVSVSGICPTKQEIAEKELPYLRPPVFIVGTHADKPFQEVKEMELQIQKEICGKGYGSHVIPGYISIDNTQSSSDAGVNELRKEIMKVLKQEPYMGEEVPVRWFNFQKVVEALVAEKIFFLNLKQLQTIAQKVCFIESEDEVDIMLDFYHDLGMIIKHRSTVVLQAQWLIDVFKQLITIPRYEDMNSKDRNDWECLERKGILHKTLVDRVFSKFIQQGLVKEDILDMMERFGLIAKFSTSPSEEKYFVPSQLKWPPEKLCEMEPSPYDPCPLYLDFLNGFVPHGLFYQLVSRCIRWCSENGFKQPPTLFCNGAGFLIKKHFFYHLILFCKKRFIKIILKQIKPTREAPLAKEEEVTILVRRLLEQSLQDLSLELPWLGNLKYKFRVACPYCPKEEKSCHKHDQISCANDDCLCLLKMVPPEQLMCEESFSVEMRMVPGIEKWFSSEDLPSPTVIGTSQGVPTQGKPGMSDTALRVTLLASEWSSSMGGLSTINRQLATLLAKHEQVEVTLLVPQFACSEEEKRAARSCNVIIREAERRPGYNDPLDWLSFPPRDLAIDIVLGHGGKLGKQAQVIRESHHCKWVQVVHTAPEELGMHKNYPKAISKGEEKNRTEVDLCKLANLVVAVGPKLTEAYSSYLRSCKKHQDIIQLTPGTFSEFSSVKQATNESDKFKVLTFGRGDPEDFSLKGYDIASKAIVELKDRSYRLIFVGAPEGKQEEVADSLLQSGISKDQLIVRKFVQSKERLKDLFCEADLAIMPSRTEGFGLTALEALSAGLPILVSGNSGFGDALRCLPLGKPLVVDSADPKDWAKEIRAVRLKDRAERLEETRRLRTCYQENYSWVKQCEALVEKMWSLVHAAQVFEDLRQMRHDVDQVSKGTDLSLDLKMAALDKGFSISDNQGSGNCLFYALSEQLKLVKGIEIPHEELRSKLVQYLKENPKTLDGTDLFHFVNGYQTWADYLTNMERDGTWGDHVILYATADCYQTCIHVISSLSHLNDVIIRPSRHVDDRNPLMLGHIHEIHYVSLHPIQGHSRKRFRDESFVGQETEKSAKRLKTV